MQRWKEGVEGTAKGDGEGEGERKGEEKHTMLSLSQKPPSCRPRDPAQRESFCLPVLAHLRPHCFSPNRSHLQTIQPLHLRYPCHAHYFPCRHQKGHPLAMAPTRHLPIHCRQRTHADLAPVEERQHIRSWAKRRTSDPRLGGGSARPESGSGRG